MNKPITALQLAIATATIVAAIFVAPIISAAWERYYPAPGPRRDAMDICFKETGDFYGRFYRFEEAMQTCIEAEKVRSILRRR
jgi:hypothetical protein